MRCEKKVVQSLLVIYCLQGFTVSQFNSVALSRQAVKRQSEMQSEVKYVAPALPTNNC